MTGHPRLYRRNATYYHRAAIPIDINDTYLKSEETFSLGTKDYAEALRLVRIAAVEVDRKFEAHRHNLLAQSQPPLNELRENQIKELGEVYYAHLLQEDEDTRDEGFFEPDEPLPPRPVKSFEGFVDDNEAIDGENRHANARGKIDPFYVDEAEEILTWTNVNIRLASGSSSWKELARELQRTSIKAAEAIRSRNEGDVVETPVALNQPVQSSAPFLSVAAEEWASEKARSSWVNKTETEHRIWMAHFITISGDKPITDYGKADGRVFKQVLLHLPANWNKHKAIKGLSIREAAEKAKSSDLPPMSETNYNNIIGFVSAFWTWADANYDNVSPNPLRGLKVKKSKQARDDRDPFTTKELKAIFTAPIYTGCESTHHWKKPGDLIPKTSGIYWVPLISLFTGARLGEIIQLYTEDICEEGGRLVL
ncbi:MAG: integrase [Rhizobiaceae bacterium]